MTKEFRVEILRTIIKRLNQALDPVVLYEDKYLCRYKELDSPQAWACSRNFEYARLIVTDEGLLVRASCLFPESQRLYPELNVRYGETDVSAKVIRHLLILSEQLATPGWSDYEIEQWKIAGELEMIQTMPAMKKYFRHRRQQFKDFGVLCHRQMMKADVLEGRIARVRQLLGE